MVLYSGLVRQYLREEPAEDLAAFAGQAGLALALEERFLKQLAAVTVNALGKALGGK